jgi:hypothetical protein
LFGCLISSLFLLFSLFYCQGLPFPSKNDPKIRLKRDYLDEEKKRGHSSLSGQNWYVCVCDLFSFSSFPFFLLSSLLFLFVSLFSSSSLYLPLLLLFLFFFTQVHSTSFSSHQSSYWSRHSTQERPRCDYPLR